MKKRTVRSILLAVVSAALAILAYIVLPEIVVVQFSAGSSAPTTMPKLLAILIPTALGVGGAVASLFSKADAKSSKKSLLISVVGIGLGIVMIVVNSIM